LSGLGGSESEYANLYHDLKIASDDVITQARSEFDCDNVVFFSFNPATGAFLDPPHVYGNFLNPEMAFATPRTTGITREVMDKGVLLVRDVEEEAQHSSPFAKREQIRSFMAVRIAAPQRLNPFAVLFLNYRTPRQFSDQDRNALLAFADRVTGSLHQAWSRIRDRSVIDIGNAINRRLGTVEELFTQLSDQLPGTVNTSHWFGLGIVCPSGDTFDLHYKTSDTKQASSNLPLSAACHDAIVADRVLGSSPELEALALPLDPSARSTIFAPLTLRGAALGFLLIQHPNADAYDAEDQHAVEILANHVANALNGIEVFRAFDTLRNVGQLLTGEIREQTPQQIAEKIKDATQADLVLLYSYRHEVGLFDGAPLRVGRLLAPDHPQPSTFTTGDLPTAAIALDDAKFAPDAMQLLGLVGSDRTASLFQQREQIASVAAVPLRVAGEPVGVLFVNFRQRQAFGSVQTRLIRGLGVFSAIAIKNTRVYTEAGTRRMNELAIIREIDKKLNKSESLGEMLKHIASGANRVIKADRASVLLASHDSRSLQIQASISNDYVKPHFTGRTLSLESNQGISVSAFQLRKTNRVNNIQNDPVWRAIFIDTHDGMCSELDVPLIDDGIPIGVLNFESRRPIGFSKEHEEFGEILAGQVVLAVKKAQDYERTKRRIRELGCLNAFTDEIVGELDADVILEKTLEHALAAAEETRGAIFLPAGAVLQPHAVRDIANPDLLPPLRRDKGLIGPLRGSAKFLNIDTARATPEEMAYVQDARHVTAIPLYDNDDYRGVVVVVWQTQHAFDASRMQVLETIVQTAAIACQSAGRWLEVVEQRDRLDALRELSETIADVSDPLIVVKKIVQESLLRTNAMHAYLDLYDDEENPVERYYSDDPDRDVEIIPYTAENRHRLPNGIMLWVAREKKNYENLGDVQNDERYAGPKNIHSEIAVLLSKEGKLLGVLNVESTQLGAFTAGNVELLKLFATEAGSHLDIAKSRANAGRQLKRFMALRDMGEALGELNDDQKLKAFQMIADRAADECDCFAVARVYVPVSEEFVLVSTAGVGKPPFPAINISDSVYVRLLAKMDAINFGDVREAFQGELISLSDLETRSLLVAPVHVGGKVLGSIGMSHLDTYHFGDPDVELIQGLAKLLAVTLVRMNSGLHERELQEENTQALILSSMGDAALQLTHTLKGGLGQISPYLDFAREALAESDATRAEDQFRRIEVAVDEVLTYAAELSKHVIGKSDTPPGNVVLSHVLEDLTHANRRPPGIDIDNRVTDALLIAYARPDDVRMIFKNLLDNAFDAMTTAGGRIEIKAERRDSMIEVEVSDNGPGIAEEDRPFVFKFGFSTKKGGTGWGLWKAQATARMNRGDLVLAESSVGARFVVKLRPPQSEVPVDS